ncbi:MAG: AI-2E family transporter [Proteobacteria bacterium]|nr:AI-2E family transporter [Pseudomonadota bacterium]
MSEGKRSPGSSETGSAASATGSAPAGQQQDRRRTLVLLAWFRRLARLWGFLGFVILVVVLARHVILPFVFALLIAYILAPVIDWMTVRADGSRRMPRGLAIIVCYLVLVAFMGSFLVVLMPRLSNDAARIGREAPDLYKKLNDEWTPQLAGWIEEQFPSVAPAPIDGAPTNQALTMPPDTAFVVTPLPDGRMAVQVPPGGIEINPRPDGGFDLAARQEVRDEQGVQERLRAWATTALAGLQSQLGDFFRFGQAVIFGLIRSVFSFFLVLMVAAFILIDLEKLHGFVRGLFPDGYRDDYDVIAAGINRGLAGVIRGQLMICLVNGILTYIGLLILQIKYSLILAAVAAVMSLIPIFGSILSTIPIVLAALVSGDEGIDILRAILSVAWIVGIHFLEANVLNPKIIGTAAKIHPVLVIFALIAGEHSYGLVGALLAVPVTSMIQVLFLFFRSKAWRHELGPPDTSPGRRGPGSGPPESGQQPVAEPSRA